MPEDIGLIGLLPPPPDDTTVSTVAGYGIEALSPGAVLTEEAQAYELTEEEMAALAALQDEADYGIIATFVGHELRQKLFELGLLPEGLPLDPPIPSGPAATGPSPYEGAA